VVIAFDSPMARLDVSALSIAWEGVLDLNLYSEMVWEKNGVPVTLDMTSLPVGTCLVMTDRRDRNSATARTDNHCTEVYVTSYFVDPTRFFWLRDYTVSNDGGQNYPLSCIAAETINNLCVIPWRP
jgi:hypothetical protein